MVRSVVRYAIARGCEAFAIFEGYEGLVQGGDLIKQMYWGDVRGWLSEGGTLSMCPWPFLIPCHLSSLGVGNADIDVNYSRDRKMSELSPKIRKTQSGQEYDLERD